MFSRKKNYTTKVRSTYAAIPIYFRQLIGRGSRQKLYSLFYQVFSWFFPRVLMEIAKNSGNPPFSWWKNKNDATHSRMDHAQAQGRDAPTKMAAFHFTAQARRRKFQLAPHCQPKNARPQSNFPASFRMKRKTRGKMEPPDWLKAQLRHLLPLYYKLLVKLGLCSRCMYCHC